MGVTTALQSMFGNVVSLMLVPVLAASTTQIATAPSFTFTTVTTETWGVRSATSICDFTSPLINTLPGRAMVFIRFDIRVTSFSSVSSYRVGSVYIDPSLQWVLAVVDVGSVGVLSYVFTYKYSEYLGTRIPNGDCELHADDALTPSALRAQLMNMAKAQPHLPIIEEDRLLSTSDFYSLFDVPFDTEYDELIATCYVDLPPLVNLGMYEAYILVNFTMPVYGGSSSFGTVIEARDVNNTWFLGRRLAIAVGYVDDEIRVLIEIGTAYLYNDGYCSVYAVTNDTFDGIVNRLDGGLSTASTPVPTMTTTQHHISLTSTDLDVNVVALSDQRRAMREIPGMKNQLLCNVSSLWSLRDSNQLACGRRCLSDSNCASIFFIPGSNTCHAHMNVHTAGNCKENRSSYFVVV